MRVNIYFECIYNSTELLIVVGLGWDCCQTAKNPSGRKKSVTRHGLCCVTRFN